MWEKIYHNFDVPLNTYKRKAGDGSFEWIQREMRLLEEGGGESIGINHIPETNNKFTRDSCVTRSWKNKDPGWGWGGRGARITDVLFFLSCHICNRNEWRIKKYKQSIFLCYFCFQGSNDCCSRSHKTPSIEFFFFFFSSRRFFFFPIIFLLCLACFVLAEEAPKKEANRLKAQEKEKKNAQLWLAGEKGFCMFSVRQASKPAILLWSH